MAYLVSKTEEEWRRQLTPEQYKVLRQKATEAPWSGQYVKENKAGDYVCVACGNKLFSAQTKFDSACGWPSFDEARADAVREIPDVDGSRTEIVCARCGGHLGHVFRGEKLTPEIITDLEAVVGPGKVSFKKGLFFAVFPTAQPELSEILKCSAKVRDVRVV